MIAGVLLVPQAPAASQEDPPAPVVAVAQPAPPSTVETAPPPAGASPGIGEIVVTAERRAESINDIPLSITAYSGEDMEQLGVGDTRDLGKVVPGFVASESGYSVPIYTLRGVGFNDISYSGTGTVGIYTDEIALPYALMSKGANLDLQRVEVVKGPQGILYGRNATGGAVNYIANRPSDSFAAALKLDAGRFETLGAEGFVSGPLTEDLAGRFAATTTYAGRGWQHSNTRPGDHLGKVDRQAMRAILDWQPRESLSTSLTVSGWRDHSEAQAPLAVDLRPQNGYTGILSAQNFIDRIGGLTGLPPEVQAELSPLLPALQVPGTLEPQTANYPVRPGNDDPRLADWDPDMTWRLHDQFGIVAGRADWSPSGGTTYTALLSAGRLESNGSALPQGGVDFQQSDQVIEADLNTVQGEVRAAGTLLDDSLEWLAGVSANADRTHELHHANATHNSFNFGVPPIAGRTLVLDYVDQKAATDAHSTGVFTHGKWSFAEHWKLSLGTRYTKESRTYEGCTQEAENSNAIIGLSNALNGISLAQGGHGGAAKGQCFTLDADGNPGMFHGKLSEDNVSFRSAVDWTPLPDVLLYASWSRGYKSGNFPVVISTSQANFTPATQERLDASELGAKATLIDHRLHVDVAAFYYDYRDKQLLTFVLDPVFGGLPVIANAPRAHVYGAELSIVTVPVEALTVTAVGSWIHTQIDEFQSTTAAGEAYDFAGRPFNYAPRVQAALIANYVIRLGGDLALTPGADVAYASHTNATLEGDPTFHIRSYTLIGARVRLERSGGPWNVTFSGHNLTDEVQQTGIFRTGDFVAATSGHCRTWTLSLGYQW